MKRWTPVRVEWVDSVRTAPGWCEPYTPDTADCVTVGMLWRETKKAVTVVLSRDAANGHVCSSMTIPKVAITRIVQLEEA